MTAPVRVLHVQAGNLYGGVESVLISLARERGLAPEMAPAFALCFDGRLATELAAADCPPHRLPAVRASRPWTVWSARRALRRYLAEHPADVVVCHAPWALAVFGAAARAAGVPLVFWQHGPAGGGHWLERWARRTPPDFAVCTSQFTAGSLANLFEVPHAVVHPPVPRPTAADSGTRARIRSATGTPANAVVIVQVGRLDRLKGHATLLDALGRLGGAAAWQCWIAGGAQQAAEVTYLAELRAQATAGHIDDRVRFLGERADVRDLLAAADIFCQPNVAPDAFGIVFVEALYAGLPVVTSALGGAVEVVDQTCGVLVPPGDAATLASTLTRLIADAATRQRLGAAGPQRAASLSDPAHQLRRFASIAQALGRRDAQ